jgi:hypothetical protein
VAQAVSEFQSLLTGLASELETRIDRLVPTVAGRLDQAEAMAFITDAYPELVTPFLAASGDLTSVWYEDQLPDSEFRAVPAEVAPPERLAIAGRWALLQDDPALVLRGAATREVFKTSRQTVIQNAVEEGVHWARHASATACGFCRMLAVRGAVFRSESSALAVKHADEQGHNHCHCIAVAVRDGTHEPAPYVEQWKRDYKAAKKSGAKTPSQIADAMDRLPGGRRADGRTAPTVPTPADSPVVNLDEPRQTPPPAASAAARLLPGLEKSLEDLRAQGLPEDSPQIQYHLAQIAKFRRQLAAAHK